MRPMTATNRAGERCGRPPIPGGSVCRFHGGAAPQVKAAAAAHLRAVVDPALGVLEYAMKRKSRMPIRYRKWSIKRTRWAWRKFSSPKRDAAPKIYSMEEWQRILASSATGFTLGVVSEPIRFWLTANLNQRRARLALIVVSPKSQLTSNGCWTPSLPTRYQK